MKMRVFDRILKWRISGRRLLKAFLKGFKYIGIGLCVIAVSYLSMALLMDTENEKRLQEENRMLEQEYRELSGKMQMIENVISDLKVRDRAIYRDVYNAELPEPVSESDSSGLKLENLFNKSFEEMIWDTYAKAHRLDFDVAMVGGALEDIQRRLPRRKGGSTGIPSRIPIKGLELVQTGATYGLKYNPFFKKPMMHEGIDLMAPIGTEVICTADGVVSKLTRSAKGLGNTVTVNHQDGYQTVYAHLSEFSVRLGTPLKQGMAVGKVGVSGNCFAACLHYEVRKDGRCQDPVHYFFGDLSPFPLREMDLTAMTTGQAMD